jgi:two-component system, LytTR family, response regulator
MCLKPSEIDWVESAGNYAYFHVGSQTRISRETMHSVQCRLEKHNFVRIHRSAIVNLDRIRKLKPLLYGDYEIELRDGTKLPMSRTQRQAVMSRLETLA